MAQVTRRQGITNLKNLPRAMIGWLHKWIKCVIFDEGGDHKIFIELQISISTSSSASSRQQEMHRAVVHGKERRKQ